jgi:hypothetical protein
MDKTITFELTIDEANYVLGSLVKMPFEQVASLIEKLRNQAQSQLQQAGSAPVSTTAMPNQ